MSASRVVMMDYELLQPGLGWSSPACTKMSLPDFVVSCMSLVPTGVISLGLHEAAQKKPNRKSPRRLGYPPSAMQHHAESRGDVKSGVSSKFFLGPIISCLSERLICLGRLS